MINYTTLWKKGHIFEISCTFKKKWPYVKLKLSFASTKGLSIKFQTEKGRIWKERDNKFIENCLFIIFDRPIVALYSMIEVSNWDTMHYSLFNRSLFFFFFLCQVKQFSLFCIHAISIHAFIHSFFWAFRCSIWILILTFFIIPDVN